MSPKLDSKTEFFLSAQPFFFCEKHKFRHSCVKHLVEHFKYETGLQYENFY